MNTTEILRLTTEIIERLEIVEQLWDQACDQAESRVSKAA